MSRSAGRSRSTAAVRRTVVDALDDGFTVAFITHTADVTTLGAKRPGDLVNLELDVMAKYVEKLMAAYVAPGIVEPATTEQGVGE